MVKSRSAAGLLIAATVLIVLTVLTACSSEPEQPDEMSFAVLSDIHLQTEDETAERNFLRAVDVCREYAGGKLDAVCVAGDMLDSVWYGRMRYEDADNAADTFVNSYGSASVSKELGYLRGVLDDTLDQEAFLYCLGNHDMIGSYGSSSAKAHSAYYDELVKSQKNYFRFDEPNRSETFDADGEYLHSMGLRYARVGRCHFITLNAVKYWVETGAYNEMQLTWLDETLAYISDSYPSDPVFIITHPPVKDSVQNSSDGTTDLNAILKKYPQTVVFTGHIHKNNYNENAISQDLGFTCVEASSVKYTSNSGFSGKADANPYYPESGASSQGLLVTVKPDSEIVICRLDFTTGQKTGPDWVIPPVGSDGRNEKYKTSVRRARNKAPYFSDDAKAVGMVKNGYLNVTFPAANDDDSSVYFYSATAVYGDGRTETLSVSSAFGQPEKTETYCVAFPKASEIVSVSVTACDSLGGSSEEIIASAPFGQEASGVRQSKTSSGEKLGPVTMDGFTAGASADFRYVDGKISNYKSSYARGNIYFDGYGWEYEFSFNISGMRLNRASTANGDAISDYRLGAALATFEYNGRIYSICASLDFGRYIDQASYRTEECKISYYLLASANSGTTYSKKIELDTRGMASKDIEFDGDLKERLRGSAGATLGVKRMNERFEIFLDGKLIDSVSIPEVIYDESGLLCAFDGNTVSAFGIAAFGAEAVFSACECSVFA